MCSVGVVYCRVEHEAFTHKDTEAYKQFVCVMICDFLPFIKRTISTLYSEVLVEQLALSTPYPLRCPAHTPTIGARSKATLDLNMELKLEEISQPLRGVAPDVFKEVELAGNRLQGVGQDQLEVVPSGTGCVALEVVPSGTGGVAGEAEVEDIPKQAH